MPRSVCADGRTGIEAIERLRAAAGAPIPAFVITGDTAPERLREASAAGFHILHKPVSPMALGDGGRSWNEARQ